MPNCTIYCSSFDCRAQLEFILISPQKREFLSIAVWTVSETDSNAHPLKQLVIRKDILDFYEPAGANIIARQQLRPVYHRNGVAYAMTRDCILNKKNIMGDRTSFVIIDEPMVNIDTELDFKLAEFLLRSKGSTGAEST